MRSFSLTISAAAALYLAGCATEQPAPVVDLSLPATAPQASGSPEAPTAGGTYRVVRGDTLYAIAFKHGLDYRDIAAWNGIAAPYRILVGQELRLNAPSAPARTAALPVASPSTTATATAAPIGPAAASAEPVPGAAVTSGIAEHPASAATSGFQDVSPVAEAPQSQAAAETASPPAAAKPAPANPPTPPSEKPVVAAATTTVASAAPVGKPPVLPTPVKAPVTEPLPPAVPELSSGGVNWRWPSDGKVIAAYVSGDPTRQGIDIAGKSGDPVHAAADGEIVYSGNGLIGYGELIIVKHNANFLSAYGHNRSRLVKEGDKVKAGQAIAEMGASAGSRDELHFEIRKNGKPVNPLEYLPAR
jgi:lipoprotein NlpD